MSQEILAPGIYPSIPMERYLAMPAVSASMIRKLVDECPRAAWFESWLNPMAPARTSNAAQNAGTIAHSILLEGNEDCVEVIDPNDYPTKTTGNIPDGWTNKDIRAARDRAYAVGKVPVIAPDMVVIRDMVTAACTYIESLKETEPAIWACMQPGGGDSELTLVWDEDGVLCRARHDRISTDRRITVDYKTTKRVAEPDTWGRTQMTGMGYYVGGSFYRRSVEKVFGVLQDYIFLVQQQEAPHLCSLVGMDLPAFEFGMMKVARGLNSWAQCVKSGNFPAYPTRVCYPEIPPYERARFEGRVVEPQQDEIAERDRHFAEQVFESLPETRP